MGAMPVYTLTILAAAALVVWVYHQDTHEREPWYGVIIALLSGFSVMWLLGIADDYAIISHRYQTSFAQFLQAPVHMNNRQPHGVAKLVLGDREFKRAMNRTGFAGGDFV